MRVKISMPRSSGPGSSRAMIVSLSLRNSEELSSPRKRLLRLHRKRLRVRLSQLPFPPAMRARSLSSAKSRSKPLRRNLPKPRRVGRSSEFLLRLYQMNRVRKERLKETLDKLDPQEHAEVFKIVKRYTGDFTRTETGVLVSSDVLPDQCLQEMETLVAYFLDQRKRMDAERK